MVYGGLKIDRHNVISDLEKKIAGIYMKKLIVRGWW